MKTSWEGGSESFEFSWRMCDDLLFSWESVFVVKSLLAYLLQSLSVFIYLSVFIDQSSVYVSLVSPS